MSEAFDLVSIALSIAPHLPGKWKGSKENRPYGSSEAVYIIDQTDHNRRFELSRIKGDRSDRKDRLSVTGEYPRYVYRGKGFGIGDIPVRYNEQPSITLDPERPIKTLAADIARRFLPAFLDVHAQCMQLIDRDNQRHRTQFDTARAMMDASGGALKDRGYRYQGTGAPTELSGSLSRRDHSQIHVEAEVYAETVNLKITLKPDEARAVVELLGQFAMGSYQTAVQTYRVTHRCGHAVEYYINHHDFRTLQEVIAEKLEEDCQECYLHRNLP